MQRLIRWCVVALLAAMLLAVPAGAFTNGHADPAKDLSRVFIPPNAPPGYVDNNTAYLSPPAAASMNTMRLCAVRDGVDLYPGPSHSSPAATAYRPGFLQLRFWRLFLSGKGPPAARVIPDGHGGWIFTSNHGLGNADDLALVAMWTWTLKHGGEFGWSHAEGARVGEGWHYTFIWRSYPRPDPGTSLRYPNLMKGSGGRCQARAVVEVQHRLGLPEDGEYGKKTVRAVKRFQGGHHLKKTGRVTSDTWLKLRKVGRDLGPGRDPRTVGNTLPGQTAPMAGADVVTIQGLLNSRFKELGRPQYRIKVDGLTGPGFTLAVKRFQILANRAGAHLKVSGLVDDATYAQLLKRRASPAPQLLVTIEGANLVADFEGRRLCPYLDRLAIPNVWTIGYGHTSNAGPPTVGPNTPCLTNKSSRALLHKDLNHFAVGVTALMVKHHVQLTVRQFNAIVSFAYNVGLGALEQSQLLRELVAKHYRAAADQLLRWTRAGGRVLAGLVRRRQTERLLFLRGTP